MIAFCREYQIHYQRKALRNPQLLIHRCSDYINIAMHCQRHNEPKWFQIDFSQKGGGGIHHICHFCSTDKILVHFCSTQKYVNCDKMDFARKQRKSRQDSIHCKFVAWSKVWYREQFVVDPHNKITP